jgi:YHS domain-containing protein
MRVFRKLIVLFLAVMMLIINSSCMVNRKHMTSKIHTDPVCENSTGANQELQYPYNDVVYYFDSEECLQVFKKNPERFSADKMHNQHGFLNGKWWVPVMVGMMVVGMGAVMIFNDNDH